jgi:hypothetical protein
MEPNVQFLKNFDFDASSSSGNQTQFQVALSRTGDWQLISDKPQF